MTAAEASWDSLIPSAERAIFEQAGYGERAGPGAHPALLVIDMLYDFVGDRPEPIEESIRRFRNSCGEVGWRAIPSIQRLIEAARGAATPSSTRPGGIDLRPRVQEHGRARTVGTCPRLLRSGNGVAASSTKSHTPRTRASEGQAERVLRHATRRIPE